MCVLPSCRRPHLADLGCQLRAEAFWLGGVSSADLEDHFINHPTTENAMPCHSIFFDSRLTKVVRAPAQLGQFHPIYITDHSVRHVTQFALDHDRSFRVFMNRPATPP